MMFYGRGSRVFMHRQAVDMRKQHGSLAALVRSALARDVMTGDVFVFVGKDRKRAKALVWDGTGLCLYAKVLSRGHFAAPWTRAGEGELTLTMSELALFFEGSEMVLRVPLSPPLYDARRDTLHFA